MRPFVIAEARPDSSLETGELTVGGSGGRRIEQDVEVVGVNGAEEGVFALDVALTDQVYERFFEGEGAFLLGQGDFLMKVLQRVTADMVAGAVADQQQLGRGNAASAFFGQ